MQFERSGNGLGLSLAGNKDLSRMSVYIVGIQQDSPVARDGRIRVGDELLEVCPVVCVCLRFVPMLWDSPIAIPQPPNLLS